MKILRIKTRSPLNFDGKKAIPATHLSNSRSSMNWETKHTRKAAVIISMVKIVSIIVKSMWSRELNCSTRRMDCWRTTRSLWLARLKLWTNRNLLWKIWNWKRLISYTRFIGKKFSQILRSKSKIDRWKSTKFCWQPAVQFCAKDCWNSKKDLLWNWVIWMLRLQSSIEKICVPTFKNHLFPHIPIRK